MQSILNYSSNRQDQKQLLLDCQNRQDVLSTFFRIALTYLPSVYMFVNITLVIWIAQTVFNTQIKNIPNSLYLLSPFIFANPIKDIKIIQSGQECPKDYQKIILKRMPTIYSSYINHQQLYTWGQKPISFCKQQISPQTIQQLKCSPPSISCSGYCATTSQQCPITNILISSILQLNPPNIHYTLIYNTTNHYYYITKDQGIPMIGLMINYINRCANDQYSNYVFNNQQEYWNKVMNCSDQGTIDNFTIKIDQLQTNTFFANNHIPITITSPQLKYIYLSQLNQFILSNTNQCKTSSFNQTSLSSILSQTSNQQNYKQILLLICFIFLTLDIIWLIVYNFISINQKMNNIAVIYATIEIIVVGIFFDKNNRLIEAENFTNNLIQCMRVNVGELSRERYGIGGESFKMILFLNAVFLGLYLSSWLLDYAFYQDYKRSQFHLPKKKQSLDKSS